MDSRLPESPTIFDRKLLRARQARALDARARRRSCWIASTEEMGERLAVVLRQFDRAADLGTPTDALRRVLADQRQDRHHRRPRPLGAARRRLLCREGR